MFVLDQENLVRVPAKELDLDYTELTRLGYHTNFCGQRDLFFTCLTQPPDCSAGSSLNPDRTAAGGKPLFSLRVMPWADDVSGNRSKQYNPHINLCAQNLNAPHEKLKHQYFVHFCSTSKHANSGEQFRPLIEEWYGAFFRTSPDAKTASSGRDKFLEAYDCKLGRKILFRVFPHCLPSDNPQQAESSSVVGPGGNLNCVRGEAGGDKEERESDEGYHALFSVSSRHVVDVVLAEIWCNQPDTEKRTAQGTTNAITHQIWVACRGVAQVVSDLQTETGIKDKTAQFWIDQALERSSDQIASRVTNSTTRDSRLNKKTYSTEQKREIRESLKHQIQKETYDWLLTQPRGKWDRLPEQSRVSRGWSDRIETYLHRMFG
jgi:hypothetical protein